VAQVKIEIATSVALLEELGYHDDEMLRRSSSH